MPKFNKEQLKAIGDMAFSIDELGNKPHRLFDALRNFALAFKKEKGYTEDYKKDILAHINEWQDMYYRNIDGANVIQKIGFAAMETRREAKYTEYEKDFDESKASFNRGVEYGTKMMAKKAIDEIIDVIY